MQPLTISLIQSHLFWEDKDKNLKQFSEKIATVPTHTHVVVLPEMFNTGFSMNPATLAEPMDGPTIQWMKDCARQYRKIITGSLIIEEGGKYFNRLIWMLPNGVCYHYDKRHLFAYGGEDQQFAPGEKRLIVQVNGWKICLLVCYDLRFPVWARQKPQMPEQASECYDMLIYIANWPERRNLAWKTLLQARAIENQSYVIGLNRVGLDGKDINYSGDSSIIDPLGEIIWRHENEEAIFTYTFEPGHIQHTRAHFPFLHDADPFMLL